MANNRLLDNPLQSIKIDQAQINNHHIGSYKRHNVKWIQDHCKNPQIICIFRMTSTAYTECHLNLVEVHWGNFFTKNFWNIYWRILHESSRKPGLMSKFECKIFHFPDEDQRFCRNFWKIFFFLRKRSLSWKKLEINFFSWKLLKKHRKLEILKHI